MIIGNGDLGSIVKDREGAIFFFSGVSNSQCTDAKEFQREVDLLLSMPTDKCLFYCSTISKYYYHNAYTVHKNYMESLIKDRFPNYVIFRIGNISWGVNPNTFLNNMRAKKERGEPLVIKDEYRYMIDQKEFLMLCECLPLDRQTEINVFSKMAKIKDLI